MGSLLLLLPGKWTLKVKFAQLCLTLWDPMERSQPGSSAHGIVQARTLEWVAVPIPRGSSQSRDQTQVFCTAGRSLPSELPGKPQTLTSISNWLGTKVANIKADCPKTLAQEDQEHFLSLLVFSLTILFLTLIAGESLWLFCPLIVSPWPGNIFHISQAITKESNPNSNQLLDFLWCW